MKVNPSHDAWISNFELLAPEVLLNILTNISDLHTLYNLLVASPTALHTFREYAVTVFESVLSGVQSLLPEEIQELVRAVVLTRSGRLPISSLRDFQFGFMRNRKLPGAISKAPITLGQGSIPRETPAVVLRDVIAIARHLSVLTHTCLDYYLERVRHAKQVLDPPVDVIIDAGPPSWVEEMRVARALWTIRIICDLQQSATDGTLAARGWPADDILRLLRADRGSLNILDDLHADEREEAQTIDDRHRILERRARRIRSQQEREECLTVKQYLQEFSGNECMPWPPANLVSLNPQTQMPVDIEKVWGAVVYGYGDKLDRRPPPGVRAQQKVPRHSEGFLWGQTRSNLLQISPGVIYFGVVTQHDGGWMFDTTFDPYRRLGFAIWDQKRMHLLGLMDGAHAPFYLPSHYALTWRSLLSPQQIAESEARLAMLRTIP